MNKYFLLACFIIVISACSSTPTATPTPTPELPWGEVFEGYAVPSEWGHHSEFEDANNFEMLFGPLPECTIAGDYAGFPILDPHSNYDGVEGPETIYVLASDEMIPFFENKCAERLILRGEQWRTWNPTTGYDTIIMVVDQVLREGVDE